MSVSYVSDVAQVAAGGRATSRRKLVPWLMLAPALLIAVVFFGIPALAMLRMSFNLHTDQRLYVPGFTFANYVDVLANPVFRGAIWTTIRLSLVASLVTVVIGYVFALMAWMQVPRWRIYMVGLALCPMLISEVSIIFGWWMFFPKNGLLSYALLESGLVTDKISLMYTEFAALVGLIYLSFPFCFFILLSIFDGLDKSLLEASGDLGASPLVTFREVLLPLTRTGVLVAFSQSFIWTMGTYATPTALGPNTLWTMGSLIQEQMLSKHNWPLASAFAIVLVVIISVVIVASRRLMDNRVTFHA